MSASCSTRVEQFFVVGGRILHVALVMRFARVVGHDVDLVLADDVAAEVLVEVDGFLIEHAEVARLIVGVEELFAVVDVIDIAPSAAIDGLHESVLADVVENRVPVERIFEVAHGAIGGAFGMFLVRQDDGWRNGYAEFVGERVVEELVVGRPPEGIVDDDRAVERGVLEIGAVEGDVVGDAVDDDGVWRGLCRGGRRRFRRTRLRCRRCCGQLMRSTSAPGKLFSMPNRTPIFFIP